MGESKDEPRPPGRNDLYDLEKLRILRDMEDELWALAKRRGWMVLLIVGLVGIGGVWALVNQLVARAIERPIEESRARIIDMQVQTELTKRAGAAAGSVADQASGQLKVLTTAIEGLQRQADGVNTQFKLVTGQIDAATRNAAIRSTNDFKALQDRIAGLEKLVKTIAEDSQASKRAALEYEKKLAALQSQIENEQRRFAENSKYVVTVSYVKPKRDIASQVQARLSALGFRVSVVSDDFYPFSGFSKTTKPSQTTLTYPPDTESKAQEITEAIKPLVGEIRQVKASVKNATSANIEASSPTGTWMGDFPYSPIGFLIFVGN
jgi:hypothetical protein